MSALAWTLISVGTLILGAGLGFWIGLLYRKSDSAKLQDAQSELAEYRNQVTAHFSQSAEHFQAIGSHYRQLYEHMAAGSEKLCAPLDAEQKLKFPAPADVTEIESSAETASPSDGSEPAGSSIEKTQGAGDGAPDTAESSVPETREKEAASIDDLDPDSQRYH